MDTFEQHSRTLPAWSINEYNIIVIYNSWPSRYAMNIDFEGENFVADPYSGELRTGTTHARAIINGRGQRQWYSRPRGPLT